MENILCPTDFSASADNAVLYAAELAQHMNSRIVLFHNIIEPVTGEIYSDGVDSNTCWSIDIAYEKAQRKKLEAIKNTLESTNWGLPVQYETKIKYGFIKDIFPQLVRQERSDLVVVGKKANESLKDLLTSSDATDIIQNSPCPVLIIPPQITFKPLRKIVFATDLQAVSFLEVQLVIELAQPFEAEILFLHVLTNPTEKNEVLAGHDLDRMGRTLAYKNVSFHVETYPQIEEGINQFCCRNKASMLVMGYHPCSFWQNLFSQGHTLKIADHTQMPLLVIHYH